MCGPLVYSRRNKGKNGGIGVMIISTEDIVEYLQGWQRRSGEAMNGDQHQKVG